MVDLPPHLGRRTKQSTEPVEMEELSDGACDMGYISFYPQLQLSDYLMGVGPSLFVASLD